MPKVRTVTGDQNSEELDQLRRGVHALFAILEQIASEVDATTLTAEQGFTALFDALLSGVDSSAGSHVGTGLALEGVLPTPKHPRRPRMNKVTDMDLTDL